MSAAGKGVIGVKESIQGKWFPNMWNRYPVAEMEKMHNIVEPTIPLVMKKKKESRPTLKRDLLSEIRQKNKNSEGEETV